MKSEMHWMFAGVCMVVSGCAVNTGEEERTVSETVVYLNGDAAPIVKEYWITPSAAKAAAKAKAAWIASGRPATDIPAGAVTQDSNCPNQALWVYDGTSGSSNKLCLVGTGDTYLHNYCYLGNCSLSWEDRTRAYYPGSAPNGDDGYFFRTPCGQFEYCYEFFSENGGFTVAGSNAQGADKIHLGP